MMEYFFHSAAGFKYISKYLGKAMFLCHHDTLYKNCMYKINALHG